MVRNFPEFRSEREKRKILKIRDGHFVIHDFQPNFRDVSCYSGKHPKKNFVLLNKLLSKDGAVVRALASHHCGPGSIPGLGVICGLSLLLVLVLAPRGFSSGSLVFPLSSKTNISL